MPASPIPASPLTPREFARLTGASDRTMDGLVIYQGLLEKWQGAFNLVGRSTLDDVWRRHFLDSAQLLPLLSGTGGVVVDLGSGAGFPGLVLSLMGREDVRLVDSDANKIEFLRQVIRQTNSHARLEARSIADYAGPKAAVAVSRACAPLDRLLGLAAHVIDGGGEGVPEGSERNDHDHGGEPKALQAVFLKGRTWRDELTQARKLWHIEHQCHTSLTDPDGIVLEIHEFKRR